MSYYAKHPQHGNRHFEEVDRAAMEADGWVFWPHGWGIPPYRQEVVVLPECSQPGTVDEAAPVAKRRPGRPRKLQLTDSGG